MGGKATTKEGTSPVPLILVEDESQVRGDLQRMLEASGYAVRAVGSGEEALRLVSHDSRNLILTDLDLPDLGGLGILYSVKEIDPDSVIIMMTDPPSLPRAIDALNKGAFAFLLKPVNGEELKALLRKATREIRFSAEHKKLVDRLQLTNRGLEFINRRLASLNEEMEEILHVVSHDLRSPLINIQGFSTKLGGLVGALEKEGSQKFTEEAETCLQFIQKGVERMDRLIAGLLRVSRTGRKAEPMQKNDLDKVIDDIRQVFDYQMKERSIQFVKQKRFPLAWCRKDEMTQVFSNLISNAIQYMGDSPKKEITLGHEETLDHFRFFVRDTGVGIHKKDLERVFKIFERLDEVDAQGEGLGLALVKKIIDGHDGRVWVESQKGEGSTFYFTLPKRGPVS